MNTLLKACVLIAVVSLPACQKAEEPPAAAPAATEAPAAASAAQGGRSHYKAAVAKYTPDSKAEENCEDCDWRTVNFLGHEAPVSYLGCIKGSSPNEHCHMEVKQGDPISWVVVTEASGVYHFVMETDGDPETGLDCPNLTLGSNPQVLEGNCTVRNRDLEGDPVHDFEATLEKMQIDDSYRIRFKFTHPPEGTEVDRVPIHNGEGHAHPN